jgi:hypothetical protein
MLLLCAQATTACTEDASGLACPLLMPGTLALHPDGAALDVPADGQTIPSGVSGVAAAGALVAHPIWIAAGESVSITASSDATLVAMGYGPRNAFGGFPHCRSLESGRSVTVALKAEAAGEFVVLVGTSVDADSLDYRLTVTCKSGCEPPEGEGPAPRCATLSEQGCGDVRCDGELESDAAGCLTCTCRGDGLCGPDRRAGPAGSCVLPACDCEAGDPVCGADGATWPSRCAALCAQVPVAKDGPCDIACPSLAACEAPCFGLRTLDTGGCPTCECRSRFADNAPSCLACPLTEAPVCGSDGVTYRNGCSARCHGAKLLYAGACQDGCTTAPPDCALDCAHGLRPVEGGTHCLACACATVASTCDPEAGAPVCVALPGPIGETTVGSACLALALGVSGDGARWGGCGVRCDEEVPCPAGSRCSGAGFLEGRCLLDDAACGCPAMLDPVCGSVPGEDTDTNVLETFDNACLLRCLGGALVHQGACCEAAPSCEVGFVARLDTRGCPSDCQPAGTVDCAGTAVTAPACVEDGVEVDGSACEAHFRGESAFLELCR